MPKEIIEVPVLSATVRKLGVPLSLVTRANGMVFVPPLNTVTGELVRGDIEIQTEASLKAMEARLEAAGSDFDKVLMVRIYAANAGFYGSINRVYARYFKNQRPPAHSFPWRRSRWNLTSKSNAPPLPEADRS